MIGYLQLLGMLFNRELVDNRIEGLSIIMCTYICNILLYIIDPMILYIYILPTRDYHRYYTHYSSIRLISICGGCGVFGLTMQTLAGVLCIM